MGRTNDTRGSGLRTAGAGAAREVTGWLRRGRHRGGGSSEVEVLATTVLGSVDAVERAWLDRVADVPVADLDVDFLAAPGGRGTEVRLRRLASPAGRPNGDEGGGRTDGAPTDGDASSEDLRTGLREFKSMIECGTVVRAEPQPTGRGPAAEGLTRMVTDRLRGWTTP
jgi:hypothetical protein